MCLLIHRYPKERLGFMIEEVKAPVILTQAHLVPCSPDHTAMVICLDSDWEDNEKEGTENPVWNSDCRKPGLYNIHLRLYRKAKRGIVPHRGVVRLVKATNYAEFNPVKYFCIAPPSHLMPRPSRSGAVC